MKKAPEYRLGLIDWGHLSKSVEVTTPVIHVFTGEGRDTKPVVRLEINDSDTSSRSCYITAETARALQKALHSARRDVAKLETEMAKRRQVMQAMNQPQIKILVNSKKS